VKAAQIAEVIGALIVLVVALRALAWFLETAMPYLAAIFIMLVILRAIWFYTQMKQ
jgi:hypothetical protein